MKRADLKVGDAVRARIEMISDLTDAGMGHSVYAKKDDRLIVRGFSPDSPRQVYVSHEHRTDGSFCAEDYELDPWDGVWDQPEPPHDH